MKRPAAATHHDLLTAETVTDGVTLGRYGVAVLRP
ncbi:Beta-galactosidase C-terminal domain [Streptomyces capitiformicae]|nr:Beta-galactosidase C-terminal domain [Streptomyces capitiformicae]